MALLPMLKLSNDKADARVKETPALTVPLTVTGPIFWAVELESV